MKRILMLLMAVSVMSACGDDEVVSVADVKSTTDEAIEEVMEENEGVAELSEAIEINEGSLLQLNYYGTEEGKEKLMLDFDGFQIETQFALVDFMPNEEYAYSYDDKEVVRGILVTMVAENTTDMDVDYNGDVMIVTDTKEQVYGDSGFLSENDAVKTYYGNVEGLGYYIIPIKDGTAPENITAYMDVPYEVVDGGVDPENGQLGEEYKVELQAYEVEEGVADD